MLYIDEKYLNILSHKLQNFSKKNQNLYNFRCTVCGDSRQSEHKARGYIFENKGSLMYKCHNCGTVMSFSNFLKKEDPYLYSEYVFEKFGKKFSKREKKEQFKVKKPIFNITEKVPEYLIPLDELPKTHIANDFVRRRKIPEGNELYFIEDTKKFEKTYPEYEDRLFRDDGRLIIPYRNKDKKIVGFSARALDGSNLRYIIIKATDEPMIWGMDKIDTSKKVLVTEGAFDAMFLENAIAVSGADLKKVDKYIEMSDTIFIFDNEPRSKQITNKILQTINSGHTVFIPPKSLRGKDINDMVLNGHKPEEIQTNINKLSTKGLDILIKFNQWKKL